MDLKKEAAKSVLSLIGNKSIVGLGAGSTIAHLVQLILSDRLNYKEVTFVTSSYSTMQLLIEKGLPVHPLAHFKKIDFYFDGCDQLDNELNALKNGGGIHTQEKLAASMADQFVIIGDEAKLVDNFDKHIPVVVEVLPQAERSVPFRIQKIFEKSTCQYRLSKKKDGLIMTENGNYLLDVHFNGWPELQTINSTLKSIPGLVETSLFYKMAHKAFIGGKEGVRNLQGI